MWKLTGSPPRRVLIYSGNMVNELPDGLRVAKSALDEIIIELPGELMERINTRLFIVITTP